VIVMSFLDNMRLPFRSKQLPEEQGFEKHVGQHLKNFSESQENRTQNFLNANDNKEDAFHRYSRFLEEQLHLMNRAVTSYMISEERMSDSGEITNTKELTMPQLENIVGFYLTVRGLTDHLRDFASAANGAGGEAKEIADRIFEKTHRYLGDMFETMGSECLNTFLAHRPDHIDALNSQNQFEIP